MLVHEINHQNLCGAVLLIEVEHDCATHKLQLLLLIILYESLQT